MIYLGKNYFHVSLMNLRSLLLGNCFHVIVFLTRFFHRRSSLMTGVESQRSHQTQRRSTNERGTWWSPLTASGSLTGWPRISTTHAWTKRRLRSWGWNPSKTYSRILEGGQCWLTGGMTQNSGMETNITLQFVVDARISQQRSWNRHENNVVMTHVSFFNVPLLLLRLILFYPSPF